LFGQRLRQLRKERGLSLRELSEHLDLSFSTLGYYEREERQPDLDTLDKIASFFDVRHDYLLGHSDIKTFDEYVLNNDFDFIKEQFQELDKENRKYITDSIDSVYLLLMANRKDPNALKIISKFFYLLHLWDVEMRKQNTDFEDLISSFSFYKAQFDYLLNGLLCLRHTGNMPNPRNAFFMKPIDDSFWDTEK